MNDGMYHKYEELLMFRDSIKNIFICGLHRSGTTMIEHFVHSVFDVTVLRADVPENEGQHLQDVYPAAKKYGGPGKFAFASQMQPAIPTDSEALEFNRRLIECWAPYSVGNGTVLSEKSPPNLTKIGWLRKVFPKSVFLIVVRDPRAVASATQKWSKTSLEELVFHWHVAHSIAIASLSDDCIVIRYEDFCVNPYKTLRDSGLQIFLPLRSVQLPVEERFSKVMNTNNKYLRQHNFRFYGSGAWDYFSYSLAN